MFRIRFNLRKTDLQKTMGKPQIGFVVPVKASYKKASAAARIRCYDIINYLNSKQVWAELYKKSQNYKVVVFHKCIQDHHISLAKELKSKGIKIIFDINVNYVILENEALNYVRPEQTQNTLKMLELSDEVIAESEKNAEIYINFHDKVITIEESIEDRFFEINKSYRDSPQVFLLYCGYSIKAKEILLIEDVLKRLHEKFAVKMLYICEKDPKIDVIPYQFIKYSQAKLPNQLIKGDIKIAPRDLTNSYNWGHSFTKVAYPMSVGIPAVASPVPSYLNREVTICNNDQEWYNSLEELVSSADLRRERGLAGKKVVKDNFTIDVIGAQYIELFNKYL